MASYPPGGRISFSLSSSIMTAIEKAIEREEVCCGGEMQISISFSMVVPLVDHFFRTARSRLDRLPNMN